MKHKHKLDQHGISTAALTYLFLSQPDALTSWFNRIVSCSSDIASVLVLGLLAGKQSKFPTLDTIRLILPLLCVVGVLDVVLALRINVIADTQFSCLRSSAIYIGGRPKTQTLEIAHAFQLGTEKALDHQSSGAFLQADILQYFDALPTFGIVMWLLSQKMERNCGAAILRVQLLTSVHIRCGVVLEHPDHLVRNRARGGLTGSWVAGALARIPIESMAKHFLSHGAKYTFLGKTLMSTWLDNCFVTASSIHGGLAIVHEAEAWFK